MDDFTEEREVLAMLRETPRSSFTPRTHREQLDVTGSQLSDMLTTAEELRKDVADLHQRALEQRAAFASTAADAEQGPEEESHCPICMEALCEPLECENKHRFCGDCLRGYRRATSLHSPRLLCPLCRVGMAEPERVWAEPRVRGPVDVS